ncbi:MAG: hypothetical protein WBG63_13500, partial [Phormidesmis sp.]
MEARKEGESARRVIDLVKLQLCFAKIMHRPSVALSVLQLADKLVVINSNANCPVSCHRLGTT